MQLTINLENSFDRVTFVQEREQAEKLIKKGWQPVWDPRAKLDTGVQLPHVSNYFILCLDTKQEEKATAATAAIQVPIMLDGKEIASKIYTY